MVFKSNGTFASFCKSLFRTASPPLEGATAQLWPMPVPYPQVLRREAGPKEGDFSFKRAICIEVLALNWLYLRRAPSAPSSIALGRPLTRSQWRLVRELEHQSRAWIGKTVSASEMGRSASKIESIEAALAYLGRLDRVEESGSSLGNDEGSVARAGHLRGYGVGFIQKGFFKAGLQGSSGGEPVIGVKASTHCSVTAKAIEVERLHFRGQPGFEPSPYLDELSRKIFERPLDMALRPEESFEDPPRVRIHASREQRIALLHKLDQGGRLGLVGESQILPGYQSGLFSIIKDLKTDRLIFDSRPFNTLERAPQRWVYSAASAANLCELQIPEDCVLVASGTDLRDYYYAYRVGAQRLVRNTLSCPLSQAEARQFRCYHKGLQQEAVLYPALATLAMGDACAVELGQTAHVSLAVQAGLITKETLLAMHLPRPRSPSMTGIIIDDLICLEVLASRALREGQEGVSSQQVRGMLPRYISSGLVPHEKKTFYQKVQADFWGASLDGEVGQVRASLSRVLPVSLVTSMIVRIGLVSVALLEIVVGSWTSTFLFRRRLLSLLSVVYEPLQRGLPRSTVIRLSPELAEELLLVLSLAPLAVSDLRATNSQHVYCSDASDWGIGVTRARLPEGLEAEVHRHKLRRPTWVKLLSPLRKLQRIRGQLPLDEELPGEQQLPSHPLWLALGGALQYKEILRKKVSRPTHINILELRGMAKAEEIASQEGMRRRVFQLADSQVSLGAWTKGRAASRALNQELQQSLPIHLGCNMQSSAGFLPTEYNSADGPSRNTRPQEPIISIPECFYHLPDLGPFDRWLESHGADPYTISGLPPLEELGAEIQVQVRSSGRSRAGGRAFRQPNCPLSREKGQFIRTSCDVLSPGRAQADKLEAGAIAILQHYSVEQFVLPRAWLQGEDWRPTGPGFLELSSAQKGLAAALAEYSQTWVLVLEFTEDTFQAADSRQGHEDVFQLIERGAVLGVGCSMLGSSFSRAIRPAWRSSVYPGGLESLEGRAECRVAKGNALAAFIAKVISACLSAELLYWVENPSDSFLWRLPSFITLGSREAENLFRFDQCRFLAPWRKRTTILTNSHLRGFSMFCNGGHRHRRLSGYSKEFHCCWTRASQIYPRRLRQLLGYAIAFDAGLLPGRRPITAATLAKQSHGRIGEAQNPGPRLPRDLRHRDDIDLSSIELVTANTSKLGQRVHSLFQDWCQESVGEEAARNLLSCANTAGELAKEFGYFLFSAKHPLYMYRQLLAYLQRERPMLRGHLAGAWQVVSKWERVEPIEHRSPVPHVLLRALVSLAVAWRWQRVAAVILIMFFGVARPGEVLQAARRDLLLPRDLETESATAFYLKVVAPKTRHRGLGKIQHTKVDDAHVTAFCEGVFGGLPWHERLYPGSPASFRRRWDTLLAALQVPKKLRLTPAGLRAGGAVFAYRQDIELQKLLWRMRLSNLQTLQHYVQEVGAESVVVQLPPRARELVSTSSSFFEFFLATFNP